MDSKSEFPNSEDTQRLYKNNTNSVQKDTVQRKTLESKENVRQICNKNITTLHKIHAILLNCKNLSDTQKSEFAESERYFMKLHLKKLLKKLDHS